MENDELDSLIVKETDVIDKKLLASFLKNYVRITESGEFIFEEKFFLLDAKKKIVIFLLARKVMKIKNIGALDTEEVGPKEISDKSGIPFGTVGRTVRELVEKQIIKEREGKYFVPNFNLNKINSVLDLG